MKSIDLSPAILEFRAELLKERIYATFILLAVLLTIDVAHTSPLRAMAIIGSSSVGLWAASLVASRMSYRIVMQKVETDRNKLDLQLLQHRPLLYAAMFPLFICFVSFLEVLSLEVAINIAIASLMLLLISWSLLSAKALKAGTLTTIFLAASELVIGLIVIGIKLLSSH